MFTNGQCPALTNAQSALTNAKTIACSSIARVVEKLKQNWSAEIDEPAIIEACTDAQHPWRDRKLGPVATVQMFLLQILNGNTACNHVVRLAGKDVTGGAYCEARSRLPLAVLQTLLMRCTAKMSESVRETGLWLGHRLFILDGSSFSMSDNQPLQDYFGQSGQQAKGCGFPTAHWLALVHFGSGLIQKVFTGPLRTHDLAGVPQVHPELKTGDIALGDRAFCSYAHLALLLAQGVLGIFRAHQRLIVDFTLNRPHVDQKSRGKKGSKGLPTSRWVKSLGPLDQIVEWVRPQSVPSWLTVEAFAAILPTMLVRELRYNIERPGFRVKQITLATTLLDPERYPRDELARAYGLRWNIETCFGHLKTTMQMDVLHCQTVTGVLKELTMFLLVYNMVRMTMLAAAERQGVAVERISFVDALRWLAISQLRWLGAEHRADELPDLVVNPLRPGRYEPRVRKRRLKEYSLMKRPRAVLREALASKGVTP